MRAEVPTYYRLEINKLKGGRVYSTGYVKGMIAYTVPHLCDVIHSERRVFHSITLVPSLYTAILSLPHFGHLVLLATLSKVPLFVVRQLRQTTRPQFSQISKWSVSFLHK